MPNHYEKLYRVERIQDISFLDAIGEGIPNNLDILARWKALPFPEQIKLSIHTIDTFKDMWDSINAKRGYGWDANPFVWVIRICETQ